jgi:exonuclease SbcC
LEAENIVSHLEAVFEGKISCPNCQHSFNPNESVEISEIPVLINSTNELLMQKTNLLYRIEAAIKQDRKEINDNAVENERLSSLKRALKRAKETILFFDEEIASHKDKISKYEEEIKELKLVTSEDELIKLDNQIKEQDEAGEILYSQKGFFDQKILDIDFWIYHFGKKGFLTFLTNKSIKSIEGITNSYLKQMNSELQVLIDGYTVLKSGDVREKISISIVRGGIDIANFNRYSGGEKGRIKLANILGLQHLINLTAKNGGLNFLGLDEVFEGLDKTGQMDVLNILEKLNVTSLVITHRNQPIGAANEIFIEKIKGISRIIKK